MLRDSQFWEVKPPRASRAGCEAGESSAPQLVLEVTDRQTQGSARGDLDVSPIYPSRDAKASNAAPFTED